MKGMLIRPLSKLGALVGLFLLSQEGNAQCVELAAEIETVSWLAEAELGMLDATMTTHRYLARYLIGTNFWMSELNLGDTLDTWWFTGTNLVKQSTLIGYPSKTGTKHPELYRHNHPQVVIGARQQLSVESLDGNPGRPPRVIDLMTVPAARVGWLAFCSGACLRRSGRQLFPPSDFWKETNLYWDYQADPVGITDTTDRFEDNLGLPRRLDLLTKSGQPIVQFRTGRSTNVLGWNFPQEFQLAQYRPLGANRWELHLTARGTITAIGPGRMPTAGKPPTFR